MSEPEIVGAVLRIDLRGFSGDLPESLGAPMSEEPTRDGTRTLFYDLAQQVGDGTLDEACARIAVFLDRHFVEATDPPFAGAFAKRMKLELGLMVDTEEDSFSCDLPAHLLDALAAIEAGLGLTFYPHAAHDEAANDNS